MWQLALKFLNSSRWPWLTTSATVFQATETVQEKTTVSTKPNLFINNGGNMKILNNSYATIFQSTGQQQVVEQLTSG